MSAAATAPTAQALSARWSDHVRGKTILITGPSPKSIGAHFAKAVAAQSPALIILAGRHPDKLKSVAEEIISIASNVKTRIVNLDLSSLGGVRKAAADIMAWDDVPVIDVVVGSGGVMAHPYRKTEDGLESQFASNYLGHWLLTNLLMDKILKSSSPRVVIVGSDGHRLSPMRWADPHFSDGETYNRWVAYGQSKTACSLMALSLAHKLGCRRLQAFSFHPGVVVTTSLASALSDWAVDFGELREIDRAQGNKYGFLDTPLTDTAISADQGAGTYVHAAFDPTLEEHNGSYLCSCRVSDPFIDSIRPWATSSSEAELLWKLSEELTGQKFSY